MTKNNLLRPSVWVLAGVLMSLGLAGCDQKKEASGQASTDPALPLTTGPATAIVAAPAASALPSAPRVRVVHVANSSDRYAYVDRANEMSNAIGQAPPDYGFEYEGVHPWVWRGSNREVRLVEPVEGGFRYYYYRPGAAEPYLVRDPYYSYGFADGQLAIVYDREGRSLPPDYMDRRADDASRYFVRATLLYEASIRSERRSVNAANWAARRDALDAERSRWEAQQNQQDDWRSYHAQHEAEDQAYWRNERDQRDRSARSFNDWQSRGYNGPPPPVANAGQDDRNGQTRSGQGYPRGNDRGDHGDGGALPPTGYDGRGDAGQQMQQQRAQADAAQQAQAKAVADALAQAQQQRTQADAARAQQKAQADAAQQAQSKAVADALAQAQQQRTQADAVRAQQKAQADAAQRAQAKAVADALAQAQQQRAQADAVRAQQKAQADAAQRAQAKAVADALAQAQQQRAQADAVRAQQKAQADAAQQAQAKAAAARQSLTKAAPLASAVPPKPSQPLPAAVPLTKEQIAAQRAAAKKAYDDAHPHDDAAGKPPAQP